MRVPQLILLFCSFSCALASSPPRACAAPADEFKIKRQQVFEFTLQPSLKRDGDKFIITFTSKAYCDATVAVEDVGGRIIRHLASGVLGPRAPSLSKRTPSSRLSSGTPRTTPANTSKN